MNTFIVLHMSGMKVYFCSTLVLWFGTASRAAIVIKAFLAPSRKGNISCIGIQVSSLYGRKKPASFDLASHL